MAQRTKSRRRSSKRAKAKSIGNRIFPFVKTAAPILSFVEQISAKDRQDLGSDFENADIVTKAKQMTNIIMGRISGINPFGDVAKAPQTINLAGIANKWTGLGLGGILYSQIPISALPLKRKIGSLGRSTLAGGAIGGIFDPPMNSTKTTSSLANKKLEAVGSTSSNAFSTRTVSMTNGGFSSSGDSTQGGLG